MHPTLYFGYGSNLWQEQMRRRCPTSCYLGLARLEGFRWIINERGYANVVDTRLQRNSATFTATRRGDGSTDSVVYGLVYELTPEDEEKLDSNEGVPWAYTKEIMAVDFWPAHGPQLPPERRDMLVYIDRRRTEGGFQPQEEYVYRMNKGIQDALREGMPEAYVQTELRQYIPDRQVDDMTESFAEKQSRQFSGTT